jgi:glycerol transport system permease protein
LIKTVVLASFILFACLPLLQMTLMSFSSTLLRLNAEVGEFTFANYTAIWSNPQLRSAFGNSIAYVLINICITVPVAIPAAYAFSRLSFVGDRHLFWVSSPFASPRRSC